MYGQRDRDVPPSTLALAGRRLPARLSRSRLPVMCETLTSCREVARLCYFYNRSSFLVVTYLPEKLGFFAAEPDGEPAEA